MMRPLSEWIVTEWQGTSARRRLVNAHSRDEAKATWRQSRHHAAGRVCRVTARRPSERERLTVPGIGSPPTVSEKAI